VAKLRPGNPCAVRRRPLDHPVRLFAAARPNLTFSQIGPDTWVRLTEVGGSRSIERFIVGDQPHVGHPIEIAATDERAQRLLGRRVGDIVPYHVGQLSETNYRVAEIKSGYVHVFQDIMSRFTTQHPEFEAIQSFHLDESKLLDSFTPVFVPVDRRAAQANRCWPTIAATACL
jgi:hypothetical protein